MKKMIYVLVSLFIITFATQTYGGGIVCPNSGKKCSYEVKKNGNTYTVESEYKGFLKAVPTL